MIDKRTFLGGLNFDDSERTLPANDYTNAINISNSQKSENSEGVVTNIKGTRLIDNEYLPEGRNTVIGDFYDDINEHLYYFIHNSGGSHSIFRYDKKKRELNRLLISDLLGFNIHNKINHVDLVGDYLFFTDNFNPPRRLNVKKAILGEFNNMTENYFLQVYKKPPTAPPSVTVDTDENRKANAIKGKLFQFKYRYVYDENDRSTFGPISDITVPYGDQDINSTNPSYVNNVVKVTLDKGDSDVSFIEVAVRVGNVEDFYICHIVDIDDVDPTSSTHTIDFYNNYQALSVPLAESNQQYSRVPLLAQTQSIIQPSRLVYGNVVEGYDNVKLNVDVDYTVTEIVNSPVYIEVNYFNTKLDTTSNTTSNTQVSEGGSDGYAEFEDAFGNWLPGVNKEFYTTNQLNSLWGETRLSILPPSNQELPISINIRFKATPIMIKRTSPSLNEGMFFLTQGDVAKEWYEYNLNTDVFIPAFTSIEDTLELIKEAVTIKSKQNFDANGFYNLGEQKLVQYSNGGSRFVSDIKDGSPWSQTTSIPLSKLDFEIDAQEGEIIIKLTSANKRLPTADNKYDLWVDEEGLGDDGWEVFFQRFNMTATAKYDTVGLTSLKSGAEYKFGMKYFDEAGRGTLVCTNNDMHLYVPTIAERTNGNNSVVTPKFTINHKPPSWAKTWCMTTTGQLTYANYISLCVFDSDVTINTNNTWTITLSGLDKYQQEKGATITYEFKEGDRLRVLAQSSGYGQTLEYFTDVYESEVLTGKDSESGYSIIVNSISGFNTSYFNGLVQIELFSLKNNSITDSEDLASTEIYFEVGEHFKVVNSGTASASHSSEATTIIEPLPVTFEWGDTWFKERDFEPANLQGFVEDASFSDFVKLPYWSQGRPSIYDPNFRQDRRENVMVWGETFNPEGQTNGLSMFFDDAFRGYELVYGPIMKTFYDSGKLLVLMARKVGQIQINKSTLYDDDGQAIGTVGQTTLTLGNIAYYAGDHGIGNFVESFSSHGSNRYFVDPEDAIPIRLGANGLQAIDVKMFSYFKSFIKKIKAIEGENTGGLVLGAFSQHYDNYVISGFNQTLFDNHPVRLQQETLAYNEVKKRWVSFFSYKPEWIGKMSLELVSYVNGELYVHEGDYTTIYGEPYEWSIETVLNTNQDNTKVYKALQTKSTTSFSADISNTLGQKTVLTTSNFRDREGEFYSDIKRDLTTKNVTHPLIEGKRMRDYSLRVNLSSVSNKLQRLWSVGAEYFISKFTK